MLVIIQVRLLPRKQFLQHIQTVLERHAGMQPVSLLRQMDNVAHDR